MDIVLSEFPDKSHDFRNFFFKTSQFSTLLFPQHQEMPFFAQSLERRAKSKLCKSAALRPRSSLLRHSTHAHALYLLSQKENKRPVAVYQHWGNWIWLCTTGPSIYMRLPLSNSTGICAQGHPFMESLLDNKALLYSLLASGGFVVCMVTGSVPEINQQFEIVTFPPKVIPLPTRMRSD